MYEMRVKTSPQIGWEILPLEHPAFYFMKGTLENKHTNNMVPYRNVLAKIDLNGHV